MLKRSDKGTIFHLGWNRSWRNSNSFFSALQTRSKWLWMGSSKPNSAVHTCAKQLLQLKPASCLGWKYGDFQHCSSLHRKSYSNLLLELFLRPRRRHLFLSLCRQLPTSGAPPLPVSSTSWALAADTQVNYGPRTCLGPFLSKHEPTSHPPPPPAHVRSNK